MIDLSYLNHSAEKLVFSHHFFVGECCEHGAKGSN